MLLLLIVWVTTQILRFLSVSWLLGFFVQWNGLGVFGLLVYWSEDLENYWLKGLIRDTSFGPPQVAFSSPRLAPSFALHFGLYQTNKGGGVYSLCWVNNHSNIGLLTLPKWVLKVKNQRPPQFTSLIIDLPQVSLSGLSIWPAKVLHSSPSLEVMYLKTFFEHMKNDSSCQIKTMVIDDFHLF